MVKITRYGQDTCIWCAQHSEGVEAEFKDGLLRGFLCKRDFWRAVQVRQQKADSDAPEAADTPPGK